MAEIWLARQRGLAGFNRFVVIKKILNHLSEQETFVKMFLDEARTSAQLNHPNVVQIYDLGREADSYYIAMEFIAGENLAAIAWRGMKRGRPLSPQFAARIIADTCKALHYAHHLRGPDGTPLEIVHRDISPQNILVTYEGEIKVVDFGIAKAATKSEHTRTGMLKGKFSYMSPEQCLGTPVDMRSDIFALGILLYELCTGKRLFKHESELMILEMITKRSVVPPSQVAPGISPRLEEVIMTALEKPVEARFQTAQDMQIALEDYLREEERSATNADIASYMRGLFEDKIEEKRLLREAASRDDFESAFGEEEPTDSEAANGRGGPNSSSRRKVVHGLPPNQVRVMPAGPAVNPGSMMRSQGGVQMPTSLMQPGATPNGPMLVVPGGTPGVQAGYPPGVVGVPGMTYGQGISYSGGSLTGGMGEGGGLVAKLVIGGALVVIIVASTILYQQLVRSEPTQAMVPAVGTNIPQEKLKTGKLLLDSSPTGAQIYLDDKPMMLDSGEHARTPSDLTSLQYGTTYKIRLVKEGHEPFEQVIVMGDATNGATVKPTLKAMPGKIVAEVAGTNANAVRVYFSGEDVGVGPTITQTRPANGQTIIVTSKLAGHQCTADPPRVRIVPDGTVKVTIRCEPGRAAPERPIRRAPEKGQGGQVAGAPEPKREAKSPAAGGCQADPNAPPAFITIDTRPVSDIYIGGRKIGQTPLAKQKVPSGCVEFKAVTADGKSAIKQAPVEPNKVSIFKFEIK
jgi:eukaryotic-like serine/threonine-protein kinase